MDQNGDMITCTLWKEHSDRETPINCVVGIKNALVMRILLESTIYLIKTIKSLILNQIVSNAPVLCSANKSISDEIQHIQKKVQKIIDIKNKDEGNSKSSQYQL